MALSRTIVALLLVLMASAVIPAAAVTSTTEIPTASAPIASPMISFEGLSAPCNASYNATELHIPSSIRKYELLTFDIPKMRAMLAKNETIIVRINGIPYKMNLYDSTGVSYGSDPSVRDYNGNLENVNKSEIGFTIGNKYFLGDIRILGDHFWFSTTPKTENGKVIQYVYSYKDVVREGPSIMIDDVDVTLRPPATTKTTEELSAPQISNAPPMVSFDGISTPCTTSRNATELHIHPSITKYQLFTLDLAKMRTMLANNQSITIRIGGVPYRAVLHDSTGKAEGLDPAIRSYRGSLEGDSTSEIAFTAGKRVLSGSISHGGIRYDFESTPGNESGRIIQYVYSSQDVIEYGQPTYWGNDYVGHGVPAKQTDGSSPTQRASLPFIIPLSAVGLIGFFYRIR